MEKYGYGIMDKNGKIYLSEQCVSDINLDLQDEVDEMNHAAAMNEGSSYQDEQAPYRVVELFYKTSD